MKCFVVIDARAGIAKGNRDVGSVSINERYQPSVIVIIHVSHAYILHAGNSKCVFWPKPT